MRLTSLIQYLFILLFSFSLPLFAAQFANPYQGNIVVTGQSEAELKELALKQVLVKVSGNVEIATRDESKLLLEKTGHLLSQYGYQTSLNTRYFMAVFDEQKVNQALKDMQQPVWGDTRPDTLMWLIMVDKDGRRFISDNMQSRGIDSEIESTFQNLQRSRGIRLIFPLMDLDDNLAVSVSDVQGRFYRPIAAASERYGLNHFTVANLKQSNTGMWSLSWQLITSDNVSKQTTVLATNKTKGEKLTLISAMVSQIADYYAQKYAILENEGESFSQTIFVQGIDSLSKLTQLNKELSNLRAIAAFTVTKVQGSRVTVNIKINGGVTSFKNGLFAQPHLQQDLSQGEEFHFNWH